MYIVMIESSPHKNGSPNTLAGEFIRGAMQNGHDVKVLDVAKMNIAPCLGCPNCWDVCDCVQYDDMTVVREKMLKAVVIVFITPVYFYQMTSSMKAVIDRSHCFYHAFREKGTKTALIVTEWRTDKHSLRFITEHYKALCEYIGYKDIGIIYGTGCWSVEEARRSPHMKEAYQLGFGI